MTEQERFDLINADYDALRRSQGGRAVWLISQHEGDRLWDATLKAFIQGNWVAAVLCAQATCERTFAALIYNLFTLSELPKNWERWGLGELIAYCRKERLVEEALLDEVAVLCEERKPYGHWRGPLEDGALLKVAMDAHQQGDRTHPDLIMERHLGGLAYRSSRTALLTHFGDLIDPDKHGRDAFGEPPRTRSHPAQTPEATDGTF